MTGPTGGPRGEVRQRRGVRALVLAAGRGERLRPLTEELPKPLLPVCGRPLVTLTLERLKRAGCAAAALNLHHLGARIRAVLGDAWRGLPLVYSEEAELLGTGGALPPLAQFLEAAEAILVVNGDSLCRWPVRRLLRAHRASGAAATLLVHRRIDPRGFGGGVAIDRGRITALRRGSLAWESAPLRRVYAGAAVLDPALVARLPAGPSDIVAALYEPLLAEGAPIVAVATARDWHDLGTPRRYLEAALEWALRELPAGASRVAAEARVSTQARVRDSNVEAGARIARGARVRSSLVLAGARVGADAELERVIVGPGVAVPERARLREVMLTVSGAGAAPRETPLGGEAR